MNKRYYVAINDCSDMPEAVEVFVDLKSMNNFLSTHPGWVAASLTGYVPCWCDEQGNRQL